MPINKFSKIVISSVILSVIIYGAFLIWVTWPISEYSINKSGAFGDSFGVLTSLFSGLAFSGMLMSIPEQSGQPFHGKADSDSIPFRTPIPFESGQ